MSADAVLGGGAATLLKPAYTTERDRARVNRMEQAAARTVASNATGAQDCAQLLDMLGLTAQQPT